jgi:hypothetical protein
MRLLLRLIGIALAGYGAWALYNQYGDRVRNLSGPAKDFSEHAQTAAQSTADTFRDAGSDVADSLRNSASEIDRAATDAGAAAMRTLQTSVHEPTRSS